MNRPSAIPREVQDALTHLGALDEELSATDVDVELCLVGGVVMPLVFDRSAGTRRPSAMFGPRARLQAAERLVRQRLGLDATWLDDDATRVAGPARSGLSFYEGRHLRAFAAPAEYVLAFKCAALRFTPDPAEVPEIEADLRYLMRYLNLREATQVLNVVSRFLNERQRPPDLEERVSGMLVG